MTISAPDRPVVVQLFPSSGKYHLAYADDPLVPIKRPGTQYDYVVEFGKGPARHAKGVKLNLTDVTNDRITFTPQGSLESLSITPQIRVYLGPKKLDIAISPVTGTIYEIDPQST